MNCKYKVNGEVRKFFYGQYSGMTMYSKDGRDEVANFDVVMEISAPHTLLSMAKRSCSRTWFVEPLEELVSDIKQQNRVFADDLCSTLIKYGIDCLTLKIRSKPVEKYNFGGGLIMSFRSESPRDKIEDMVWIDYKFTEDEYVRKPEDCYKLVLVARNEEVRDWYPREDYYVCDLVSLISARPDLFELVVNEPAVV